VVGFIGGLRTYRFGCDGQTRWPCGGARWWWKAGRILEIPGIMEGTQSRNYGAAVDLLTKAAIQGDDLPSCSGNGPWAGGGDRHIAGGPRAFSVAGRDLLATS